MASTPAKTPAKARKPRAAKSATTAKSAPAAAAPAVATNTDKPQEVGVAPALQALEAGGPEATANDSAGSAAGAVNPADANGPMLTSKTAYIVVKGPKGGFRRADLQFGHTLRALAPSELGDPITARRRLLALLREPRLDVRLQMLDGTTRAVSAEEIAVLDSMAAGVPESQLDPLHVATIAALTGEGAGE